MGIETIEQVLAKATLDGDCHVWNGGLHPQGLPMIRYQGKMVLVSRLMKENQLNIKLSRDQRVKNTCGNKLCINPEHYDVIERHEKNWQTKAYVYSPQKRKELCDDWASTPDYNGKYKAFMKKYSMTDATIRKILREGGVFKPMRNTKHK